MFGQICKQLKLPVATATEIRFATSSVMSKIIQIDFEVFGIVQGVSFRMYTEKQAKSLGVRGWCMNTPSDTVKGQIEAPPDAMAKMKTWLEKTGSPASRIDKTVFGAPKELDDYTFPNFTIRH